MLLRKGRCSLGHRSNMLIKEAKSYTGPTSKNTCARSPSSSWRVEIGQEHMHCKRHESRASCRIKNISRPESKTWQDWLLSPKCQDQKTTICVYIYIYQYLQIIYILRFSSYFYVFFPVMVCLFFTSLSSLESFVSSPPSSPLVGQLLSR